VVSFGAGIVLATLQALRQHGAVDSALSVLLLFFYSMPSFWLALMLIMIFSVRLDWLPATGIRPVDATGWNPLDIWPHLILPTIVLAMGLVAGYSRYMRASMLETIGSDYVRTARSKGLTDRLVWFRHAARNALIPLATFLGPAFVSLIAGAVITETIFSWPGVGRFAVNSITSQDYPVIMAFVVIAALSTIIAYIISDILYAVFDPRIRLR